MQKENTHREYVRKGTNMQAACQNLHVTLYTLDSSRNHKNYMHSKSQSSVPSVIGHCTLSAINSKSRHTINIYCSAFELVMSSVLVPIGRFLAKTRKGPSAFLKCVQSQHICLCSFLYFSCFHGI